MINKQEHELNREQHYEQQQKLREKMGSVRSTNINEYTPVQSTVRTLKSNPKSNQINQISSQINAKIDAKINEKFDEKIDATSATASLSKLCRNQAEEISILHEQLQQREIDLKEIRYNYVSALKAKKINEKISEKISQKVDDKINEKGELCADNFISSASPIRMSGASTSFLTEKKNSTAAVAAAAAAVGINDDGNEESSNSNDDNNDVDVDNEYYLSQNNNKYYSLNNNDNEYYSSNPNLINQSPSPSRKSRDYIEIEKNEKKSVNDISSINPEKNEKNRRKNYGNSGNSQLLDLIEFRNTATREYEKLKNSFDLLKSQSEERKNIVEQSTGRLIRFVSGNGIILLFFF